MFILFYAKNLSICYNIAMKKIRRMEMEIGKLPNDILDEIVISNIKNKRKEILLGASIGMDNAIIDFGEDVCVMSTDPITGATKDIGKLAIHISCNDVSASGAEPLGVLLTILLPPSSSLEELEEIMLDASKAAEEINVEIMGGHTEVTDGVNRIIINTTVVGKQRKNKLPNIHDVKVGDKLLMTKYGAIEGTSILAKEREDYLKDKIQPDKLIQAQSMDSMLSVVEEGILLGDIGVKYMHDITEGGIYGACWEASQAINKGIKVKKESIPFKEVSMEIGNFLNIDIYRLISSGSMLFVASPEKLEEIEKKLGEKGIKVSLIGEVIDQGIFIEEKGQVSILNPPEADELYRALR